MLGIGRVAVNPQQMQQQQGQQPMRPGQQQAPIPPANRYGNYFRNINGNLILYTECLFYAVTIFFEI